MKVAMIEDDPEIIEVVTIAFETAWPGSEVVAAPNAVEGLEMLRTQSPDVVILDVGLPEGDASGFELCKEFRSSSNTPVIMVTARNREQIRSSPPESTRLLVYRYPPKKDPPGASSVHEQPVS